MKAGTMVGAALCCALAVVALAALPAAARVPAGVSAKSCSLSDDEINGGLGASYVYSLDVRNLDCDKAKKLVKKFHKCRHANGGAQRPLLELQGLQLQGAEARLLAAAPAGEGHLQERLEEVQADLRREPLTGGLSARNRRRCGR